MGTLGVCSDPGRKVKTLAHKFHQLDHRRGMTLQRHAVTLTPRGVGSILRGCEHLVARGSFSKFLAALRYDTKHDVARYDMFERSEYNPQNHQY